jgi:hypothetical protein
MATTFSISPRSTAYPAAFDRQELYQSQSAEIRAVYDRVLPSDEESLTTVLGNDVRSRFRVAYAQLPMTAEQCATVQELEAALRRVEMLIDPKQLYFSISSSPDEDVVLNHRQEEGLCTLIVHDDGSLALARIYTRPKDGQRDELRFVEPEDADYERLVLQFLSGQ